MTYREKLAIEHPDCIDPKCSGGCKMCPDNYGYCKLKDTMCGKTNIYIGSSEKCTECWDQVITGTENLEKEKENEKMPTKTTRKTKDELIEEIKNLREELERTKRMDTYVQGADETKALMDAFINSGFTREEAFELVLTMVNKASNI